MKRHWQTTFCGLCLLTTCSVYATCNNSILKNHPNSIYTDHANGTVTDSITKLMWQKCSLGQSYNLDGCTGVAGMYSWAAALESAQTANTQKKYNYNDWRLPNVNELATLVEYSCSSPAINEGIFPNMMGTYYYWSSTPNIQINNEAEFVSFGSGAVNNGSKEYSLYVRLVRGSN